MSSIDGFGGESSMPRVTMSSARSAPFWAPIAATRRWRICHRVWPQISPSAWTSGPTPNGPRAILPMSPYV